MPRERTATDFGLFVLRFPLAAYFAAAGVGKLIGEFKGGFGSFYTSDSFTFLRPEWMPDLLAMPYAYALQWLQVVLGLALVLGFYGRIAAALIGLLLASFTLALAMKFGIAAQEPSVPGPFSGNYLQLAAYVAMVALGPGRWSVDAARGRSV